MEMKLVQRIFLFNLAICFCHRHSEGAMNGLIEREAEFGFIHPDQMFISMQLNSMNALGRTYSTLLARN